MEKDFFFFQKEVLSYILEDLLYFGTASASHFGKYLSACSKQISIYFLKQFPTLDIIATNMMRTDSEGRNHLLFEIGISSLIGLILIIYYCSI